MTAPAQAGGSGPILFAYDGSDLAQAAINEAGRLLAPGRDVLVVTAWKPFDLDFSPPPGLELDAEQATDVKAAAEQTAADGARLAQEAGFRADSLAVEASPASRAIIQMAEEREASLIVLGSHGRRSLAQKFLGSVASDVVNRSPRSVLVVHRRGGQASGN